MSDQGLPDFSESLDIAIIGMAGRFPGAIDVDAFWRNLCAGVESLSQFSDEELLAEGIPPDVLRWPVYVKAGMIVEDIESFDGEFFGYSPRESEAIDPQQRLFLECAWEALEHAGYVPAMYAGLISVFAGVSLNTYMLTNVLTQRDQGIASEYFQIIMGGDKDFIATRAAYKLGLRGPAVTVQTACSTSLVATHLACQSLLSYQSDIALAGGASLSVPKRQGYVFQEGGILSPDGHCRTFDARAQGAVKGNGVGLVVLKRLADAVADGDRVYAVIKGSAINNDGGMKIGYTAPSQDGQAAVIAAAHAAADVTPDTISYVEAHGTATPIGDPIEMAALTQVFRAGGALPQACAVGCVKTNIGHLDAAAGVAGLMKVALSLYHRCLPPSLHFERPNPQIDFRTSPFYVQTALTDWQPLQGWRRAGVSAFGIGGTNAHVVLEEAPWVPDSDPGSSWQLLTLSARTGGALEGVSVRMQAFLDEQVDLVMADVAYTTQVGRQAFPYRRIVVCAGQADARRALQEQDAKQVFSAVVGGERRSVVFMFPGGGTQYVRMGADLYGSHAVFRAEVDRCAELLRPLVGYDIRGVMYDAAQAEVAAHEIERTGYALPALFTTEYALARQVMAWGLCPQAMIGHSLGEYVAACLAGVMTLEDALALVTMRGRLFEGLPPGAMLSLPLSEAEVQPLLGSELSIAAINGPTHCVVAGSAEALEVLEGVLAGRGVQFRRLPIAVAAHSVAVEPMLDAFAAFVRTIRLQAPTMPYISNVTGRWADAAEVAQPTYWVRHLRQTVRFSEGIGVLLQFPQRVFVEIGPGQTLSTLTRGQGGYGSSHATFTSMRHPHDQQSDEAFLLTMMGRLWLAGVEVDWRQFHGDARRQRVALPTYPFERQRYWIERRGRVGAAEDVRCLVPVWQSCQAPVAAWEARAGWVVFADVYGVAAGVVARLQARGDQVVQVVAGAGVMQRDAGVLTLDPSDVSGYATLMGLLAQAGVSVVRVVYLWGIEAGRAQMRGQQARPVSALTHFLALLQVLRERSVAVDVLLVTSDVHAITGAERLRAPQAALLGAAMAQPTGEGVARCRAIDVSFPTTDRATIAALADVVFAEADVPSGDALVAYRGGRWWRRVDVPPDRRAQAAVVSQGGVYLVCDGPSGGGLALARGLSAQGHARVVLVEPRDFPGEQVWGAWLESHADDDAVSAKIRALRGCDAYGMSLLVQRADVRNGRALRALLRGVQQQGAEVQVVHAGLFDDVLAAFPGEGAAVDAMSEALHSALEGFAAGFRAMRLSGCVVLVPALPDDAGRVAIGVLQQVVHSFVQRQSVAHGMRWCCLVWNGWFQSGTQRPDEVLAAFQRGRDAGFADWVRIPDVCAVGEQEAVAVSPGKVAQDVSGSQQYARPDIQTPFVAPRDALEQQVAALWTMVLGIDPIGVHDSFFELRGDSLTAIQLVAMMQETFRVSLPMRSVFETPNVAGLAKTIRGLSAAPEAAVFPRSLVALQPNGALPPFFCVHPAGGTGVCYAELARLVGPDQPFYGIQALGIDGEHAPRDSVVAMAMSYVAEVRALQPSGPYRLGGWSMGGTIAFEMAQQLVAQGEQIACLILIDTPAERVGAPPSDLSDVALVVSMIGAEIGLDAQEFVGRSDDEQVAQILARAQAAHLLPPGFTVPQFRRVVQMFRMHAEAWWAYAPQGYPGRLVLLRAIEALDGTRQWAYDVGDKALPLSAQESDVSLGWQHWAHGGVEVYPIPGNHQTLMQEPHVRQLARQLRACLERLAVAE